MKITMSEMKNILGGLNSKLVIAEANMPEVKHTEKKNKFQ